MEKRYLTLIEQKQSKKRTKTGSQKDGCHAESRTDTSSFTRTRKITLETNETGLLQKFENSEKICQENVENHLRKNYFKLKKSERNLDLKNEHLRQKFRN